MTMECIHSLTAKQKEAIRLVAAGYETGEIARKLGISEAGVVSRIEGARQKCGGVTRKALARALSEAESSEHPIEIRPTYNSFIDQNPLENSDLPIAVDFGGVQEERAQFGMPPSFRGVSRLSGFTRSLLILLVSFVLLIAAALLKPAWDGLGWLGRATAGFFR